MKILIMNAGNTYNYGAMMMAENFISYFNNKFSDIEFYIEDCKQADLDRLKEATEIDAIYFDEKLSVASTIFNGKLGKIEFRAKEILRAKNAKYYDLVFILGGDTFSEVYSKHIGVYLPLMRIKKINNVTKLYMVGQTIGPYTDKRKAYAAKVFSKVNLYSRDETSRQYLLNELGVEANDMRDLAFLDLTLQDQYKKDYKNVLKKYGLKENEYITFVGTGLLNLYTPDTDVFKARVKEIIGLIKKEYSDKKIVWLSHVTTPEPHASDNTLLKIMNDTFGNYINDNMMVIDGAILPVEARTILGNGYFTLTCRMHAAVSTFQMGKPAICLSYSPKYEGVIAKGLNMSDLVIECKGQEIWENQIVDLVREKMKYVDKNYKKICDKIKSNVNSCQKQVQGNLDEIIEEINN